MAGNNKIELRKLKDSFFSDHGDLKEIMKKEENKVRGYTSLQLCRKHPFRSKGWPPRVRLYKSNNN